MGKEQETMKATMLTDAQLSFVIKQSEEDTTVSDRFY